MQTTDPDVIRGWFADPARPDMNYSVCPGQNGVILDPDLDEAKEKDGIRLLEGLEAENFEDDPILGHTFSVRTPRGGFHLYLSTPHAVSNRDGGFPKGIDVRGAGGYVVGPGCRLIATADYPFNGEYVITINLPVMAAPPWVLARLDTVRERDANAGEVVGDEDTNTAIERIRGLIRQQTSWPTEGQGGDRATYEFITLARNYGAVTPEKMYELLNEPYPIDDYEVMMLSWNERCAPPWEDSDLALKIENAYTYATSAAGSKGGMLDSMDMEGAQYLDRVDPELAKEKESVKSKLDAMYFPSDTLRERPNRREYVIDQWMLAHGMTQLLAFRSTGKSIVLIDLCLRIACGMEWFGNKVAEDWAVVYACGEDDEGMQAQMDAWYGEHNVHPKPDRFIVMTGVPNLNDMDDCVAWVKFLLEKLKGRRAIFAVDTWQRATSRVSQNDDDSMNIATDNVDWIASQLRGPSIIAFHPPKSNMETISGSLVIENKGTAIWKMQADAVVKTLKVARIKGKGTGNFLKLFFNEVELPYKDQWDKPATAIVVAKAGDNNGDSKLLKEVNNKAKTFWATIAREVILLAHEEQTEPKLTQIDMAQRIAAWREANSNNDMVRRLGALNESIPPGYRAIQLRLKSVFVANAKPVDCHDGVDCIYVEQSQSSGNAQKYIIHNAAEYRLAHPDQYPAIIPPVLTEGDLPEGEIAY